MKIARIFSKKLAKARGGLTAGFARIQFLMRSVDHHTMARKLVGRRNEFRSLPSITLSTQKFVSTALVFPRIGMVACTSTESYNYKRFQRHLKSTFRLSYHLTGALLHQIVTTGSDSYI